MRIDTCIYPGYKIPSLYDSMIAKLIAHGRDRMEAILIMRRALDEFAIEPIKTTIPLHKRVFEDGRFIKGKYSTSFIQGLYPEKG